jgi:MinD superfamily P-loop ATPase
MIITVASGKGGTGKTLVATSLALSLQDSEKVTLLDCDVEEPDDHVLLRPSLDDSEPVNIPVPVVDEDRCTYCGRCAEVCAYHAIAVLGEHVLTFPQLCHGCGACAYLCPEKAISEEPRETGVVESISRRVF